MRQYHVIRTVDGIKQYRSLGFWTIRRQEALFMPLGYALAECRQVGRNTWIEIAQPLVVYEKSDPPKKPRWDCIHQVWVEPLGKEY